MANCSSQKHWIDLNSTSSRSALVTGQLHWLAQRDSLLSQLPHVHLHLLCGAVQGLCCVDSPYRVPLHCRHRRSSVCKCWCCVKKSLSGLYVWMRWNIGGLLPRLRRGSRLLQASSDLQRVLVVLRRGFYGYLLLVCCAHQLPCALRTE